MGLDSSSRWVCHGSDAETAAADVMRMFQLNGLSAFLSCREAAKRIRLTGEGGRIVNVCARPVLEPVAGMAAYSMSKAAVAALTRTLGAELNQERILVNAIVPSIINTAANRAAMPDADHESWPTPEQLALSICHLVSAQNSLTTGLLVPVYGRA